MSSTTAHSRLPRMVRPDSPNHVTDDVPDIEYEVPLPPAPPAPAAKQRFLDDTPGHDSPIYGLGNLKYTYGDLLIANPSKIEPVLGPGKPILDATRPSTVRTLETLRTQVIEEQKINEAIWSGKQGFNPSYVEGYIRRNFSDGITAAERNHEVSAEGLKMLHTVAVRAEHNWLDYPQDFDESKLDSHLRAQLAPSRDVGTKMLEINGHMATDLLRITNIATKREILYAAGQEQPFYEFKDEAELKAWVLEVGRSPGGAQQLSRHFKLRDRFDRPLMPGRPPMRSDTGLETILQDPGNARRDIHFSKGAEQHNLGPVDPFDEMGHHLQIRTTDDYRYLRTKLTDTLNAHYEKTLVKKIPGKQGNINLYADIQEKAKALSPRGRELASQVYRAANPSQDEDLHDGRWMKGQREINEWGRKIDRSLQTKRDYELLKPDEIAQSIQDQRPGTKVDPIAVLDRANEIGTANELQTLSREFQKPTTNLYFVDPMKLVAAQRHEPPTPLYGNDRGALQTQRKLLEDLQSLTASPNTERYKRITDKAWELAGLSAGFYEEDQRKQGNHTRMTAEQIADWAHLFDQGIKSSQAGKPIQWDNVFGTDDSAPPRDVFKNFHENPPLTEVQREAQVRQRQDAANRRTQVLGKTVHWIDEADHYKIPMARHYLELTQPSQQATGDPEQQEALMNTFRQIDSLPESNLYKNIPKQGFDNANKLFRESMANGGATPDPQTYLSSAWGLGVQHELRQTRLAAKIKAQEARIKQDAQRDADGQRVKPITWQQLKDGTEDLKSLFNEALKEAEEFVDNPAGWVAGKIMDYRGQTRAEIDKMKKDILVGAQALEAWGGFTPAGPVLSAKAAAGGIIRFARRRLNQGMKFDANDLSDLATTTYNLIGTVPMESKVKGGKTSTVHLPPISL